MKNFINWIASIFEEDNGKASMKRFIVAILIGIFCYALIHIVRNGITETATNFLWTIGGLIFGFCATLLTLTFIPSFTGKPRNHEDGK